MRVLKNVLVEKINNFSLSDSTSLAVEHRTIDVINLVKKTTPLGSVCYYVPNDISLFLNQQKLAQFNPSVVSAVVNEFKANSTSLSDSLSKYSDEQIISTVKSRYIQSVTDMSNYLNTLTSLTKDVLNDLANNTVVSGGSNGANGVDGAEGAGKTSSTE